MKNYKKLDQLTALRFFAAFMIVIHHSLDTFSFKHISINWGQGVSFFFVLSGFILTYVYSKLETFTEIMKFLRARIARVWPAYFMSFIIACLIIPYTWHIPTALTNLLMIQAWIPKSSYYFSYNAVAWSVSTELFFYFTFPFLLYKWEQTWKIKFFIAAIFLIILLYIVNYLHLPEYGQPGVGENGYLITQHGLVYISPLSRVFEFVLGMVAAILWQKKYFNIKSTWATLLEILAIALCVINLYHFNTIADWGRHTPLGDAAGLWLSHSGSLFSFALLIFILAKGCGKISQILSIPFLVWLGEISFSIYLLHQILLYVYNVNSRIFSHFPKYISFLLFFCVLLLAAHLMWFCIEKPCRRLLMGKGKVSAKIVMNKGFST